MRRTQTAPLGRPLTEGPVLATMIRFAVPMILGDLLQQCYNIADTLIVGRFLGADALAAVGSAFTLMTFLTSVLLGLAMGSGTVFSLRYGEGDQAGLRACASASFALLAAVTAVMTALVYAGQSLILRFLNVPAGLDTLMNEYLLVIYAGLPAIFLYNYFASLLRALGCSAAPLAFLAEATVLSQYVSGVGIALYTWRRAPGLRPARVRLARVREIFSYSALTCLQQSVMNFGILSVQGLVNTFGPTVMAAFAAAVKIDAFAYLPVQDFGNACSVFLAQNRGAARYDRIRAGLRRAAAASVGFGLAVSAVIFVFAAPLMRLFVGAGEAAVVAEGVRYLRIESAFYAAIGVLFLLYGLYRALGRPGMSVVLTVVSLGTRVAQAYALSSAAGVTGIWWSVPIGWFLADALGIWYYCVRRRTLLPDAA